MSYGVLGVHVDDMPSVRAHERGRVDVLPVQVTGVEINCERRMVELRLLYSVR